jgi:ribonuclease-3
MPQAPTSEIAAIAKLETALGYKFARPELLLHALTHRSQSYELAMEASAKPEDGSLFERRDNERLEFLGDAILGLVVAEFLYESYPHWQEGELTRLRAQLVSRRHMGDVAQGIGLGEHLRLGKGEDRSGGRKKGAILANAMEAVIAAIYLDAATPLESSQKTSRSRNGSDSLSQNGLLPVRRFAREHILGSVADSLASKLRSGVSLGDHKSALQEYLQATHAGLPVYRVESESGPDHRKRFQVELRLKDADGNLGMPLTNGIGGTKKKAEQEAARRALALLADEKKGEGNAEV